MNPVRLINLEVTELRWAFRYFKEHGQRAEAWKCWYEIQGLRRARRIVERCAANGERVAA